MKRCLGAQEGTAAAHYLIDIQQYVSATIWPIPSWSPLAKREVVRFPFAYFWLTNGTMCTRQKCLTGDCRRACRSNQHSTLLRSAGARQAMISAARPSSSPRRHRRGYPTQSIQRRAASYQHRMLILPREHDPAQPTPSPCPHRPAPTEHHAPALFPPPTRATTLPHALDAIPDQPAFAGCPGRHHVRMRPSQQPGARGIERQ